MTVVIQNGLGRHRGALTQADAEQLSKVSTSDIGTPWNAASDLPQLLLLAEVMYVINMTVTKLSILSMYYRLFPVRSMKIGGWFLGGISALWSITLLFIAAFQCSPLEKFWKPWIAGRCLDFNELILGIAIPNVITDTAILILPLPKIVSMLLYAFGAVCGITNFRKWRLKATLSQRILTSAVFISGCFVVVASIYRFIVFWELDMRDLSCRLAQRYPLAKIQLIDLDTASLGCTFSMIEMSSGVISACLPTMVSILANDQEKQINNFHQYPLVRRIMSKIKGTEVLELEKDRSVIFQISRETLRSSVSYTLKTVDSHELDGQSRFQIPNVRSKKVESEDIEEQRTRVMRLVK